MAIRLLAGSISALTAFALVAIAACGGSGDGSLFQNNGNDSGPLGEPYDGGSLFPTFDASGVDAAVCKPAPIGSSFKPIWRKPTASAAGKCTATQTGTFYDDCLAAAPTSPKCNDFVKANADCAACLQSDDTDSKYAPVIWHSNRAFFTLNVAGCIADEQKDDSNGSCAAAYQAVIQCEETACTACGASDYPLFPDCEKNAASECNTYLSALHSACGDELHDANDPAATCTSATSTQAAFLAIAPVFCGN